MNRQKYYIELTTDPVVFDALKENAPDENARNELEALIYLLRGKTSRENHRTPGPPFPRRCGYYQGSNRERRG